MAEVIYFGFVESVTEDVLAIGDDMGGTGAGYISQNIEAKNRVKTGHMLDDGPYSERAEGELFTWQVGLRGEKYFVYQNDGTKPRRSRGGFNRKSGGYNRGITPGEFVEDAMTMMQLRGAG